MTTRRTTIAWTFHLLVTIQAHDDLFNYRETVGKDYGPEDWHKVDYEGWPDKWELGVGWELKNNNCEWCPDTGNSCPIHRQSPIDLERAPSTTGHDPECIDYHWMVRTDSESNKFACL